jgi:putative glutathione S-transferase
MATSSAILVQVGYSDVALHRRKLTETVRHDFPKINLWLRRLYWNYPAFKNTTDFARKLHKIPARISQADSVDIKEHYYYSHAQINPTRIVPVGPQPDIEPLDKDGK